MDLVKFENSQLTITDRGMALLNSTICKGLSREELAMFGQICQNKGLDPFSNQIYAIKRGDRMTIQTGIDGLRTIAERTGEYEGQEDPVWYDASGEAHYVWLKQESPAACRVGIFRKGMRTPIRAIATFAEFRSSNNPIWRSMPAHMLSKCAEALALRKAFPQVMSGVYEKDEPMRDHCESKDSDLNSIAVELDNNPPLIPVEPEKPKMFTEFVRVFMAKAKGLNLDLEETKILLKFHFEVDSFTDIVNESDEKLAEMIKYVEQKIK